MDLINKTLASAESIKEIVLALGKVNEQIPALIDEKMKGALDGIFDGIELGTVSDAKINQIRQETMQKFNEVSQKVESAKQEVVQRMVLIESRMNQLESRLNQLMSALIDANVNIDLADIEAKAKINWEKMEASRMNQN